MPAHCLFVYAAPLFADAIDASFFFCFMPLRCRDAQMLIFTIYYLFHFTLYVIRQLTFSSHFRCRCLLFHFRRYFFIDAAPLLF